MVDVLKNNVFKGKVSWSPLFQNSRGPSPLYKSFQKSGFEIFKGGGAEIMLLHRVRGHKRI